MSVVLSLLAFAMIAMGGAAMVFGAQIIQVEKGWTMVISGSVGATGGALLLGIALAIRRLGRIASQLVALGGNLDQAAAVATADPDEVEPIAAPVRSGPPGPPPVPVTLEAQPYPTELPEPPPAPTVVGRYASGGNAYVMFSDGSVQADTPSGRHRFNSLEELRSFVAAGGERAG